MAEPLAESPRPVVGLGREAHIPGTPDDYDQESLTVITRLLDRVLGHALPPSGDSGLSGLSGLVRGKRVLVKPNLVRPNPRNPMGVVTDERVLFALLSLLRDAGAAEIWLGDNPGYGLALRTALEQLGEFTARLARLGVRLRFFDDEPTVTVPNPEATLFDSLVLPSCLLEADVYINLPKMKTHMHTLVTLGVKNQYGLILDDQRMFFHRNDINVKIADMLRVVRPHLTIVDGIVAVQGQAPLSGGLVPDMNCLLAGRDVVAVDAVATACMGIHPMEVAMLRLCRQQRLGETDLERIDVRGESIKQVRRQFARPVVSSLGAYDEIQAVEGGACFGCLSAFRHSLDKLASEGLLQGRPVQTVYLGVPMPDMVNLKATQGPLWCFGSCAAPLLFSHAQRKPLGRFIPGCPPHILEFYKAYKATVSSRSDMERT